MKKKTVLLSATAVIIFLIALYLIGTGFLKRNDVVLTDYYVSRDGTEITLHTGVMSSAGYTRGFKDTGGGVKPHYLTFYSAFGGFNGTWGAKNEYILKLDSNDSEIYFSRADGGYALVLKKDKYTGQWLKPNSPIFQSLQ